MLEKLFTKLNARKINPAKLNNGTEFEIDNWSISRFVIKRLVPKVGYHPFPISELSLMASTVCFFKPTHIFEWGTHIGKSARIFYETATYFNIDTEIHSIDLPDTVSHGEHPGQERGKLVRGLKHVTLHQGDGLNTSLEITKAMHSQSRPLFFVDGDHSYESVRRELSGILTAVPHAIVLLHDTFYQSTQSGYNVGPYNAINDMLTDLGGQYKRIETKTGLPGMTLLYKEA